MASQILSPLLCVWPVQFDERAGRQAGRQAGNLISQSSTDRPERLTTVEELLMMSDGFGRPWSAQPKGREAWTGGTQQFCWKGPSRLIIARSHPGSS